MHLRNGLKVGNETPDVLCWAGLQWVVEVKCLVSKSLKGGKRRLSFPLSWDSSWTWKPFPGWSCTDVSAAFLFPPGQWCPEGEHGLQSYLTNPSLRHEELENQPWRSFPPIQSLQFLSPLFFAALEWTDSVRARGFPGAPWPPTATGRTSRSTTAAGRGERGSSACAAGRGCASRALLSVSFGMCH